MKFVDLVKFLEKIEAPDRLMYVSKLQITTKYMDPDFVQGKLTISTFIYKPQKAEGAWLSIPFEIQKKEPLRLVVNATKSYDFGRYQASLNGVKLGRLIDFHSAKVANEEVHLLDFWPEPGAYTLRLECVGKNPISQGYYAGIESVRLRERRPRVAEMGHDKDKDWRKEPKLYD